MATKARDAVYASSPPDSDAVARQRRALLQHEIERLGHELRNELGQVRREKENTDFSQALQLFQVAKEAISAAVEDARLTAAAESDPDNPPLTDEDFARMRPADEVIPEFMKAWRKARGKQKAPTKQLVSLRLDREVIEHFKRGGRGWQSRINAALRKAAES